MSWDNINCSYDWWKEWLISEVNRALMIQVLLFCMASSSLIYVWTARTYKTTAPCQRRTSRMTEKMSRPFKIEMKRHNFSQRSWIFRCFQWVVEANLMNRFKARIDKSWMHEIWVWWEIAKKVESASDQSSFCWLEEQNPRGHTAYYWSYFLYYFVVL